MNTSATMAPVAIPSLAEMPSVDATPVCEYAQIGEGLCTAVASWRVQLAHMRRMPTCDAVPVLLCDLHCTAVKLRARTEMRAAAGRPCQRCNEPSRDWKSIVRSEVAL